MRCLTCNQVLPETNPLRVSLDTNIAMRGPMQARLKPQEAEMLYAFLAAPGRFLTYEQIADSLWGGYGGDPRSATLKVYVWNLKRAIRPLGYDIENLLYKGYLLKEVGDDARG